MVHCFFKVVVQLLEGLDKALFDFYWDQESAVASEHRVPKIFEVLVLDDVTIVGFERLFLLDALQVLVEALNMCNKVLSEIVDGMLG